MMDINTHEEYVTPEQAMQLFELGFDWECRGSYHALSNLKIAAYPVNYNQRPDYPQDVFPDCLRNTVLYQVLMLYQM